LSEQIQEFSVFGGTMSRGTQTIVLILLAAAISSSAVAQQSRITSAIDNTQTVALKGTVSPLAKPENDLGPLDPSTKLPYVTMLLKSTAAQEAARKQLAADQQNPSSKDYHKWLTPEEYGDRFGMSHSDITALKRWLRLQGFTVVEVARARNWIAFSSTVGEIERVFHTQIHRFTVDGEERFANASAPSIPKGLEGIVSGFRGLDNFKPKSMMIKQSVNATPDYNDGAGAHSLAPDDLAAIYDIAPLYNAGVDGTGMKIAIMGQTQIHVTDIQQFRAGFNLPANNPTTTLGTGCTDPGYTGDEGEADLDLEWSGAVARNATILFVICDITTNNGVISSLQYAVNNNVAPVLSMSYGLCEQRIGTNLELTFYEPILTQAVMQGQTLMVSSADDNAAGCDNQDSEAVATMGFAVNGFASPPEATAVGGTEFDADVNNPGTYWNASNNANGASAKGYIPELAWNDGTLGTNLNGGLWGTGGGASASGFFAKPIWQTGTGVPNDGHRDLPDIAMASSGAHDGYIFCTNIGSGGSYVGSCANGIAQDTARVGGTSAAAPVFAGIMVLLNHYLNKNKGTAPGLGNINPMLYSLAASTPTAFHDIPAGNYSLTGTPSGNIIPCQSGTPNCPATAPFQFGFITTTGYDQVTGLGSVNANVLVTNWSGSSGLTPTTTTLQVSAATVTAGTSVTLTATISPAPPDGETVTFVDTTSSTVLGTKTTAAGVAAFTSTTIAGGTYNVEAKYPGDTTLAASISTASTLNVQDISMTPNPLAITVTAPGQSGSGTITFGLLGGLTTAPSFACTGLPSESTCTFTAASATTETVTIGTTAASSLIDGPLSRGKRIFYATLFPALLGLLWPAARRKSRARTMISFVAVLVLLMLWLPACSSSGGGTVHNPGTPVGQTNVTVTATSSTVSHTITVNLNVQ
jgi:subtilase family serine protease